MGEKCIRSFFYYCMCALLRTCTVVGLVRTIRNITSLFCIVTAVCDDDDGGLEWSGC